MNLATFNIGDIVIHKRFGWFALVLNIEPLIEPFKRKGEIVGYLYRCHRFDCGGYTFNEIDTSFHNLFAKVTE